MTWSYSGNPSLSDLDAVRFAVGDTDTDDQLILDAEINYLLAAYGSVTAAAIKACESLAAKFSRMVDRTIGDLRLSASQKAKQYLALAATLRTRQAALVAPFAGGISISDKETREADTDRVQPAFTRRMQENPDSGDQWEQWRAS